MKKEQINVKLKHDISNKYVRFKGGSVGVVEKLNDELYEFSSIPETAFWVICKKEDFEIHENPEKNKIYAKIS